MASVYNARCRLSNSFNNNSINDVIYDTQLMQFNVIDKGFNITPQSRARTQPPYTPFHSCAFNHNTLSSVIRAPECIIHYTTCMSAIMRLIFCVLYDGHIYSHGDAQRIV